LKKNLCALVFALLAMCCARQSPQTPAGTFEPLHEAFEKIVSADASIEVIAEGYTWSEGPLWIESQKMLLFSDVPANTVYRWRQETGTVDAYLAPAGYTGAGTYSAEPGANGLLLDDGGNLILCQHGNRQLARMASGLAEPRPEFAELATHYNGRRFNSPNDVALSQGSFFFTDPPYGLPNGEADSSRELPFQGVFQLTPAGQLRLLIDSLSRPNGIAFFPDGKSFLVANSDPAKAIWCRYAWDGEQALGAGVFYDATPLTATQRGLPDGLKIDRQGHVFATGPGGIFVFDASGLLLGKIRLSGAASNCALSADEKTLFVTNHTRVLKITLRR
jgi:gluconolactonase